MVRTPLNIVYIHSHDTGRWIQPFGTPFRTPNLQRLAEQGISFRNAFCAAPTCSPSRAALLTGQSPHSAGMLGLAHRGFALTDHHQHLSHVLAKAGYDTALCGVQHEARDPKLLGYQHAVLSRNGDETAAAAVAYLSEREWNPKPFFLAVGFFDTHREFPPAEVADDPRWMPHPPHLPDTPNIRADVAGFSASARRLDANIGAVLEAIDRAGLAENTLILSTTDHGPAFPGMKCCLSDRGIGVYLILRGPTHLGLAGGRVCDAMVSQVDLYPTICDVIGIDSPVWLQGRSMVPLLDGSTAEINDEIFSEVTYHAAYEPKRAIRTRTHKLIRRFSGQPNPVPANCDDSPSKNVWIDAGWLEQKLSAEALYDLTLDASEQVNVVGDAAYGEVLTDLRERLDRWMQKTGDPLLHGQVVAPTGAKLNHPGQISPQDPTTIV